MKRLTQAELETQAKALDLRTGWPADGTLPLSSTFTATVADFRGLAQEQELPDAKRSFKVFCRDHGCLVRHIADRTDPINNYIDCGHWEHKEKWFVRDLPRLTDADISHIFYVELLETDPDTSWPLKLIDKTDGKRLYSAMRPCTREEIAMSRVKRIFTIRGFKLP